tara:strand:- start:405 stop:905 length:501 start_codon:yes stop_codon:yes gene_type:complete
MNKLIIPIIIFAALSRLIPHPPNFTPIIAMCLFGGAYLKNYRLSILIILSVMILSDFILGFHKIVPWVYMAMILITLIGVILRKNINMINCILSFFSASLVFFFISNLGVWFIGYEKSISGFVNCYIMAIPFLHNTLISTFMYGIIMFGGYKILKNILQGSIVDSV